MAEVVVKNSRAKISSLTSTSVITVSWIVNSIISPTLRVYGDEDDKDFGHRILTKVGLPNCQEKIHYRDYQRHLSDNSDDHIKALKENTRKLNSDRDFWVEKCLRSRKRIREQEMEIEDLEYRIEKEKRERRYTENKIKYMRKKMVNYKYHNFIIDNFSKRNFDVDSSIITEFSLGGIKWQIELAKMEADDIWDEDDEDQDDHDEVEVNINIGYISRNKEVKASLTVAVLNPGTMQVIYIGQMVDNHFSDGESSGFILGESEFNRAIDEKSSSIRIDFFLEEIVNVI